MKRTSKKIIADYGYERDYFVPTDTCDSSTVPSYPRIHHNGLISLYFKGFKKHSYCINSFGRLVELPKGLIIEKIVNGEKILLFKNLITGKIYIINDRGMLVNEVSDSLWNHSEM